MISNWVFLIVFLIVICIAAEIFTNGLEHLGEKIGISEGVTGSIFAAVATALPETTIPVLSIVAGTSNIQINEEISVGAILGAPIMLSTLSILILALVGMKKRGFFGTIRPEYTGFVRDLHFFIIAFLFSAMAMWVPHTKISMRILISFILIMMYIFYLLLTIKASKALVQRGHQVDPTEELMITKLGVTNNMKMITLQMVIGLSLLVLSAKGFIHQVAIISSSLNISALLLSLLIIPIATELPEKVNSIIWLRNNKDTMAFGNITGAMVFQGTLLPALGIMLTAWQPLKEVWIGILVSLVAAIWLRLNANKKTGIKIYALLVNGLLYLIYIWLTVF